MSTESRKDLVLRIAIEMIANHGFAGLSTREVARRAGVSEALIFHHFGTKVGLLEAVVKSGDTFFAAASDLSATPPAENLGAAIDALLKEATRRLRPGGADWASVLSLLSRESAVSGLRSEMMGLMTDVRSDLADWMNKSSPPPRLGGEVASATLFEGILWLIATLPDAPSAWDEAAPGAFANLSARWRALHLED